MMLSSFSHSDTPYYMSEERTNSYEHLNNHPIITNYREIMRKKIKPSIEIVDIIYLNEGLYPVECCVLKTFWLKILQRKWKQYYKNKILFRKNPKTLLYRSIHGKWPKQT